MSQDGSARSMKQLWNNWRNEQMASGKPEDEWEPFTEWRARHGFTDEKVHCRLFTREDDTGVMNPVDRLSS